MLTRLTFGAKEQTEFLVTKNEESRIWLRGRERRK